MATGTLETGSASRELQQAVKQVTRLARVGNRAVKKQTPRLCSKYQMRGKLGGARVVTRRLSRKYRLVGRSRAQVARMSHNELFKHVRTLSALQMRCLAPAAARSRAGLVDAKVDAPLLKRPCRLQARHPSANHSHLHPVMYQEMDLDKKADVWLAHRYSRCVLSRRQLPSDRRLYVSLNEYSEVCRVALLYGRPRD